VKTAAPFSRRAMTKSGAPGAKRMQESSRCFIPPAQSMNVCTVAIAAQVISRANSFAPGA
jgi:hypothetical protein